MIRTTFEPTTVFDKPGLMKSFGLSQRCISREIRLKRLRCFVRAKRQWFFGRDVIAWLEAAEYKPGDPDQEDELAGL